MAEQSLNKKHPDFKSTAETFVQVYKEKKQSFRHHETFVINRFVWNRSLSPWTSLPGEAGKVLCGRGIQNLLRNLFGAKHSFASRNCNRAMKYWLKIVNIPRFVELDNADNFPNLDRTWLMLTICELEYTSNHENKCWWPCMSWECRAAEDWVRPDSGISCSQGQVYLMVLLKWPGENNAHTSGLELKQITNDIGALCYWCCWLESTWENKDTGCADGLIRKYYFFSRTF